MVVTNNTQYTRTLVDIINGMIMDYFEYHNTIDEFDNDYITLNQISTVYDNIVQKAFSINIDNALYTFSQYITDPENESMFNNIINAITEQHKLYMRNCITEVINITVPTDIDFYKLLDLYACSIVRKNRNNCCSNIMYNSSYLIVDDEEIEYPQYEDEILYQQ